VKLIYDFKIKGVKGKYIDAVSLLRQISNRPSYYKLCW